MLVFLLLFFKHVYVVFIYFFIISVLFLVILLHQANLYKRQLAEIINFI